ncbi:EpsG family protein, partial [Proteus mirabilis]
IIGTSYKFSYTKIFIGTLFHSSYIFILFTKLREIKKKKLVSISIPLVLISILILDNFHYLSFIGDNFIIRKLNFYLTYSVKPNIYSLIIRIFFLYIICFNKKINFSNKTMLKINIYKTFWILSFLLLLAEILAFQFPLLSQRLRLYLSPFPFILFLNYLSLLKNYTNKLVLFSIIFLYLYATLFNFINGPMGSFYSLENNYFTQLFLGFPSNNIEENVRNFWLKN